MIVKIEILLRYRESFNHSSGTQAPGTGLYASAYTYNTLPINAQNLNKVNIRQYSSVTFSS